MMSYYFLCVVIVLTYDLPERQDAFWVAYAVCICLHFACTRRPHLKMWEDFERFQSDDVQVMLNPEDCRDLRPGVTRHSFFTDLA